jgi:hypothetical protein
VIRPAKSALRRFARKFSTGHLTNAETRRTAALYHAIEGRPLGAVAAVNPGGLDFVRNCATAPLLGSITNN